MTMLTHEQTEELFRFCSRHYVQFYDVQAELVDHMASAIEEKMGIQPATADAKPGISFDKALEATFLSFGPQGFSPIVKEKIRALKRQNRLEIMGVARRYFRWPAILLLAVAASVQWTLYRYGGAGVLFAGTGIATFGIVAVQLAGMYRTKLRQVRPLLANDFMHSQLSFNYIVYLQIFFLLVQGLNFYNMIVHGHGGLYALLIILLAWNTQIFFFICLLVGMKNNQVRLQRRYPLAFRG